MLKKLFFTLLVAASSWAAACPEPQDNQHVCAKLERMYQDIKNTSPDISVVCSDEEENISIQAWLSAGVCYTRGVVECGDSGGVVSMRFYDLYYSLNRVTGTLTIRQPRKNNTWRLSCSKASAEAFKF